MVLVRVLYERGPLPKKSRGSSKSTSQPTWWQTLFCWMMMMTRKRCLVVAKEDNDSLSWPQSSALKPDATLTHRWWWLWWWWWWQWRRWWRWRWAESEESGMGSRALCPLPGWSHFLPLPNPTHTSFANAHWTLHTVPNLRPAPIGVMVHCTIHPLFCSAAKQLILDQCSVAT